MKKNFLSIFLFLAFFPISAFSEDIVMYPSKDTFLRQAAPNTNEGANPLISVRKIGKRTALLAFDLSPLAEAGHSRTFQSAKLILYVERNGNNWGKDGRPISLFSVRQDWTEGNGSNAIPRKDENDSGEEKEPSKNKGTGSGTTWNCSTDTNISNFKGNCSSSSKWKGSKILDNQVELASALITNDTKDYVEFDVTETVRDFYLGTDINDGNFGWLIKRQSTRKPGSIWFYSKENANSLKRPQLVVRFP